jgi:hypothetical protein
LDHLTGEPVPSADGQALKDAMDFVRDRLLVLDARNTPPAAHEVLTNAHSYEQSLLGRLVGDYGQSAERVVTRFVPSWEAVVSIPRCQIEQHYFEVREGATTSFKRAVTAVEAEKDQDAVSWTRPDARLALLRFHKKHSQR